MMATGGENFRCLTHIELPNSYSLRYLLLITPGATGVIASLDPKPSYLFLIYQRDALFEIFHQRFAKGSFKCLEEQRDCDLRFSTKNELHVLYLNWPDTTTQWLAVPMIYSQFCEVLIPCKTFLHLIYPRKARNIFVLKISKI